MLNLVDGKVPIIIEIKYSKGIEKILVNLLDGYKGEFAIQSFNLLSIFWFRISRPKYIVGCLIYKFLYLRSILFILKPNYIATNLEKLRKYKGKYIILGYTIKTKKEYHKYKIFADNFIYDIWG